MNGIRNNNHGKTFTRVIFLMAQNPYTDRWEPMAYFPDLNWDYEGRQKVSYMHNGQHGPCCEAFALVDCIAPRRQHMKGVERLKKELEHLEEPYALTVLDTEEWLKSKGMRKIEIEKAISSNMNNGATEANIQANMANGAKRREKRAAEKAMAAVA